MSSIYIQEPPTSGKVVMKTTVGDIDIELWAKETPKACRNFIQLCMEGYYDNTIFHRVVKGFIAQGGDPTGTGEGGESIYGEPFKDEFHSRLRFVRRGLVAMANAGKDDNGSQFFFTFAASPELQNKHTIFGKVGGDTIYNMIKLENAVVNEDDRPVYIQKIIKTEVLTNPFDDIVPRTIQKRQSNEEKLKKKKKKGVKDFKLLSFGEEAEEDEEESTELCKKLNTKSKSAHDNLADPKLSAQSVTEVEEPHSTEPTINEEDTIESDSEQKQIAAKKDEEVLDRIKSKLNSANKISHDKDKALAKEKAAESDEEEEEYYLGKDRDEERKKEMMRIKKEIRDFKRQDRDEKNKHLQIEKEKQEKQKKKDLSSEFIQEFHQTQEKYKEKLSKIPKKGHSREDFTLQLFKKFQTKVASAKDQMVDKEESTVKPKDNENASIDEDDINDESYLNHALVCEDKNPVLAKDASTKGDDWFEIFDPRNPINKRRRGDDASTKKQKTETDQIRRNLI